MKHAQPQKISDQLKSWVNGNQPKTLNTLIAAFGEKSFAVIILLFMLLPALPFPTGGLTHVFEVIVVFIAAEQIIGLKAIWLPQFLSKRVKLQKLVEGKSINAMLKRITWLESKSSPRWRWVFAIPGSAQVIGLIIIAYTIAAFFSPPFSGLDTLPAMGVVLIALSMLLDDALMLFAGTVIGATGTFISIFFGAVVVNFIKNLF